MQARLTEFRKLMTREITGVNCTSLSSYTGLSGTQYEQMPVLYGVWLFLLNLFFFIVRTFYRFIVKLFFFFCLLELLSFIWLTYYCSMGLCFSVSGKSLYPPYPKDRGMLWFYVEAARRPTPAARNGVNAITQKPRDGLFSNFIYTLVVNSNSNSNSKMIY